MKNNEFDVNRVYGIIKSYYVDKMPHPTVFSAIDAINIFIKRYFSSNSYLEKTDNGTYKYYGVTEMPTDDWDALVYIYTQREIDFFQNENNILDLISDIIELQKWLVSENYLSKDGVIKGKMIDNLNLV
ncbi:hypothetical protein AB7281_23350 [Providencia rettgeri]